MKNKLFIILLIIALIIGIAPTSIKTYQSWQTQKQIEKQEEEITNLNEKLETLINEKEELLIRTKTKSELDEEINNTNTKIDELQEQINTYQEEISQLETKIEEINNTIK